MLSYTDYAKALPYKQLQKEYNYLNNAMRRFGDNSPSNVMLREALRIQIEIKKGELRHDKNIS